MTEQQLHANRVAGAMDELNRTIGEAEEAGFIVRLRRVYDSGGWTAAEIGPDLRMEIVVWPTKPESVGRAVVLPV